MQAMLAEAYQGDEQDQDRHNRHEKEQVRGMGIHVEGNLVATGRLHVVFFQNTHLDYLCKNRN